MRAVDTNVLVRLVTRDDVRQVAAAEAFVAHGAWVPHLALAEATWVLASVYDRGAKAIAMAVEMLLSHQHLTLQDSDAVGFSDCLILEVARKAGHGPAGTFDRDLGKLDGAHKL